MLKIKNSTDSTVIVYTNNLSVEILPDQTAELHKSSLEQDQKLNIRYSGLDKMMQFTERGFEKGGLRKRVYYRYEKQSHFPVATVIDTKNLSEITLKDDSLSLRQILLFKTVYVKRVLCEGPQSEPIKTQYMFLKENDKNRFLKLMRVATAITFPFAVISIFGMIMELFSGDSFMTIITVELFMFVFAAVALQDFYYTLKARKWETEKTEDETLII